MEPEEFNIVTPFWIDTDAYSDRDRLMFCCGVEFQMIRAELASGNDFERPIHTENESRGRLLVSRQQRACEIKRFDDQWSLLRVAPDLREGRSDLEANP